MIYELMHIIPNDYSEEECQNINEKIKTLATQENFTFTNEESLGKKKLSYPIKKSYFGYYFLMYFEKTDNSNFETLNKKIRIMPEILRHQIIKYTELPKKQTFKSKPDEYVAAEKKPTDEPIEVKKEKEDQEEKIVKKSDKKINLEDLDEKIDALLENVDG